MTTRSDYTLASIALKDRIGLMEEKFTHAVTILKQNFCLLANERLVELCTRCICRQN